ncbi:MAG: glycosyltransferase, partial [Thiohalocapsa sp.]
MTVAIPFSVSAGELQDLLTRPGITSAVAVPPLPARISADRLGSVLPADYSWRLPARLGTTILFVGGRDNITARMIRTAFAGGAKRIICWNLNRWKQQSVLSLAFWKTLSKVAGLSQRVTSKVAVSQLLGAGFVEALTRRRLLRLLNAKQGSLPTPTAPIPGRVVIACPTLVAGGAERQIVNTAIGLHRHRHADITVLVSRLFSPPGNDFFHDALIAAGVDVQELQSPTSTAESWNWHQTSPIGELLHQLDGQLRQLPPELRQEVANTYIALRELRPSVVHAWLDHSCVCAGIAALMAGVPRVILSGRNVSPIHFAYILQPYMRPAYHAMAARPETVFVNNSHGGADDYAEWLGIDKQRFNILYNGIDLTRAEQTSAEQAAALRHRHGIPDDALLIGGMFRLAPEKRPLLWVETLTRLAKDHPDVRGIVFGEGPLQGDIETPIAQAGMAERIIVAQPTKDSATALAAFDVLLLTSRWEGTPNVVIEAQAAGTPVVVSGGGGAPEALENGGTGLFVEQPDAGALARAVSTLLEHAALRRRLGEKGPAFVAERFGLTRMLTET